MLKKSAILYTILMWVIFLILNGTLFLPAYVVESIFLYPAKTIESNPTIFQLLSAGNKSIFSQLSGELLLLFLPIFLLRKDHWSYRGYKYLFFFAYLLLLYYAIYYFGYQAAYSVHPNFANDWVIIKEILPTFFREIVFSRSNLLGYTFGFLAISFLLLLLINVLINWISNQKKLRTFWLSVLTIIFSFGLSQSYYFNQLRAAAMAEIMETKVDSMAIPNRQPMVWMSPKINQSATLNKEDHLAHLKKRWVYDFYKQKTLKIKPNIYLIFVESYGGVATFSDYCEAPYDKLSKELTSQLDSAGWQITSNYSKSTVIGGRSWLAMTTAMIGARVEDQIQYSDLIKNQRNFPHMIDFFNQQGYETIRLSSMRVRKIDTLSMITIPNTFWKIDQQIFFPDIPYNGHQYDYYGGIPDQYTLSYANDELIGKSEKPVFYSCITMNSHGPWHTKTAPIVKDWRILDTLENPFGKEDVTADMTIQNYWIAIEYQLKMLTDFVLNKGRDDSIYIILGDHNPGGLEYKMYGKFNKWATPIHIISKDSTFTKSFEPHGFTEGMKVDTANFTIMRHMGLYSLLTRQLLENYGEEDVVLPEYLPWGLTIDK